MRLHFSQNSSAEHLHFIPFRTLSTVERYLLKWQCASAFSARLISLLRVLQIFSEKFSRACEKFVLFDERKRNIFLTLLIFGNVCTSNAILKVCDNYVKIVDLSVFILRIFSFHSKFFFQCVILVLRQFWNFSRDLSFFLLCFTLTTYILLPLLS